ncbi:UNVERIFIED_CONTAM: hypothetical protein HDU68_002515 [Siphonaria sp. JEL0065]|nr:hypothetical protein HDU68_002515 [Siphonaria sp. JEL0065]
MQKTQTLFRDRLTLVNPVDAFRRRMAGVRTDYFAEALLDRKEAAMAKKLRDAENAVKAAALKKDIAAFKRAQAFDWFSDNNSDDVVREALNGSSPSATSSASSTSKSNSKASATAAYIASRSAIRAATETRRQEQLRRAREHSLLYLLYATDSFVTRDTLDRRINDCLEYEFSRAAPSNIHKADFASHADYNTLARLARQTREKSPAAEKDASEGFIVVGKPESANALAPHSHATIFNKRSSTTANAPEDLEKERRSILADVATGKIAGRDGVDIIRESL